MSGYYVGRALSLLLLKHLIRRRMKQMLARMERAMETA